MRYRGGGDLLICLSICVSGRCRKLYTLDQFTYRGSAEGFINLRIGVIPSALCNIAAASAFIYLFILHTGAVKNTVFRLPFFAAERSVYENTNHKRAFRS